MKLTKHCLIALAVCILSACGGGGGNSAPSTAPNTAPEANAGQIQNAIISSVITLDGSKSSDANGDTLTYRWTLTSKPVGSAAVLAMSTSARPSFTADLAGTYVATLIVNDGQVDSATSTVTVTATHTNASPVASAGTAQNVNTGSAVTLDGSASSDANGDALTYRWTLASKPLFSAAVLTTTTSPRPSFIADLAGTYVATLTVNDGQVDSASSTVMVTATRTNAAPVASAGTAQNVNTGSTVTLDGSASSDANGDTLTYRWTLTSKPVGSAAVLAMSTSARPSFTADLAGTYVATLIVNDGQVDSASSTVTVTSSRTNAAPVASAGTAQNVNTGSTVTLDGSASSDANGDTLTYRWTLTSKPVGSSAILAMSTSARPSFTADLAGTYVATLIVNDGKVDSALATVTVTSTQPKIIGVGYTATNSMTVTLVSFSATNLGNGYTRYSATYKQENKTSVAIDEATLKLYFTNADAENQYGFFGKVLPGSAYSVTRTYSWDVQSTSTPMLLQYHENHFFSASPIDGALQWLFPIH